ncbi:uncharacterized protein LOC110601082 [Manihot esculenta]|uniref:Uncharacterized protein n=1 Tax=Manihot esculenta TaxID=3983 RepID=A0A2C9UJ62_MANES|nr:uncharacterized protein LOC110601082 [Manihot esculenta]OAY30001.1 hypothetical protein MANES_15G188900v8 [Manihot esculenta]
MALYIDEVEVWKCPKHPSKKRRTGICHVCLRERLSSLCPDCANVRPCGCSAATTSSTSSSSSSSHFSSTAGIGTVGRVSSLIESEPSFRRSRSLAIPFLRSKPPVDHDCSVRKDNRKTASPFWSLFKSSSSSGNTSNRGDIERNNAVLLEQEDSNKKKNEEERKKMMRKSRSVAATVTAESRSVDVKSSKGKGWYFPSPIKAFKQSTSRGIMVQERSPLYRG